MGRNKMMLPVFAVIAVMALFVLPGLAAGNGGSGGPKGESCPPSSPRGQQDPTATPTPGCGHASLSESASASESESASASESESASASESESASASESESASASESESASASASASAGVECSGFVHLADSEIIAAPGGAPLIDGLLGVHVDALPGADPQASLARACVGLGSAAPLGVDCEGPLVVAPVDSDGLFVCVEA